jgi:hypothetical protein
MLSLDFTITGIVLAIGCLLSVVYHLPSTIECPHTLPGPYPHTQGRRRVIFIRSRPAADPCLCVARRDQNRRLEQRVSQGRVKVPGQRVQPPLSAGRGSTNLADTQGRAANGAQARHSDPEYIVRTYYLLQLWSQLRFYLVAI